MESGGGVNKYLHKKFKKQTSIEASVDTACLVAIPLLQAAVGVDERLPDPDPFRHSTNNCDVSALKSSITYPVSFGSRRGRAYSFVSLQEEPPGATALVVRKVDSTSSEQSDEDISHNAKIKRSPPKEQDHLSSSTLPESKISRLSEDAGGKEDVAARVYDAQHATTSSAVNGGKYVCPYCNLVCSKPSVLQKHIRAHTNERPYPCQSCNFSFKTRSNLYKHCRSRTHVNRVMGNKSGGGGSEGESTASTPPPFQTERPSVIADAPNSKEEVPAKAKPYKPRFHTKSYYENENEENSMAISNEKNTEASSSMCYAFNKILDACEQRLPPVDERLYMHTSIDAPVESFRSNGDDQPLNLTSKNRKRCLSEVSSEPAKKSLIKELLLKNLSADTNLQCPHCKMIFRTYTELELHKMKMCKGRGGPRYSRSSSVNVASILTQNKNAFDSMPQNVAMFALKSPGPFLGKTRLVESDKSKSFSCDDSIKGSIKDIGKESPYYQPSFDFYSDKVRKPSVKLFGGEVKVTQTTSLNDPEDVPTYPHGEREEKSDYHVSPKVSENRVIRNTLQSGGIMMHALPDKQSTVIKMSDKVENRRENGCNGDYSSIMDFSHNAAKLLAPNLKQLNLAIPSPLPSTPVYPYAETTQASLLAVSQTKASTPRVIPVGDTSDPMSLLVNGKVVRYVPGMPGPVIAETFKPKPVIQITPSSDDGDRHTHARVKCEVPSSPIPSSGVKLETLEPPPPVTTEAPRKFARPNSLALKPSSVSLKHHHGLTPTLFNQILISPDTPRGDKKYNEQLMNGNYYSNLGLKSSTKPVYCTLNKTQPFYVPHFRKLSMYSEWRQQDKKGDKWYVLEYDSRQRSACYSVAGKYSADNVVHSRYKFIPGDVANKKEDTAGGAGKAILGGYESQEDHPYIRGRGRGRFVCDQCGMRCEKPSMLKRHIRIHSNDRPYTCKQCKFSFKTKGNLTKHLKSRVHMVHVKNYGTDGTNRTDWSKYAQLSGTPSSDSDTDDDSGMNSSDDTSTRNQEHEAAYGLLSLSQKVNPSTKELPSPSTLDTINRSFINAEQLVHVFKTNYVKNKILDQNISLSAIKLASPAADVVSRESVTLVKHVRESRPLTYPYTTPITAKEESPPSTSSESVSSDQSTERNIIHFNVIKRYNPPPKPAQVHLKPKEPINYPALQKLSPVLERKVDPVAYQSPAKEKRRQVVYPTLPPPTQPAEESHFSSSDNSEAMDLSCTQPVHDEKVAYKNSQNRILDEVVGRTNGDKLPERYQIHTTSAVQNGLLKIREYDNSAMETLADIATKQEKLEKNSVAKNVATEFLKLATQNEEKSFGVPTSVVTKSDLIVKSEENKNCMICNKTFNKPSQLRLHMNIHYLERPYRCESCSVSFRTKGHLQKHERSAGHHNKLSSSPALSSQEPRPFKCIDCSIAFRIHGHLAKHLRSKMHILKLECLSKVPFGLYAELERSNSLLTEINTADGDQCLDSLKSLARRIFINDPGKLTQLNDGKVIEYQSSETTAS